MKTYNRVCPICNKKLVYHSYLYWWRANRNNCKCRSCSKKGKSPWIKGRHHTEVSKNKNSITQKGRKLSSEYIHNLMLGHEHSKYQRKTYTLGNEIISIQGYENLTLDKLISESISIDNIKIRISEKPKIKYELNGSSHWYYPDCYIKNSNILIETKSTWTWKKDLDRNLAKIKASVNSGYKIRVIVWDGKKELVSDTIYT